MKVGRKADGPVAVDKTTARKRAPARSRGHDGPARKRRPADGPRATTSTRPSREPRGQRQGPATAPTPRPVDRPARPKTATQAQARAHARKAKAPRVIRPSLRQRLIARLEGVDLRPRTLLTRIPFVMLVIGALALGLGITLWLSTASAQRSYQLGTARTVNDALSQQKEALERDVLEAQSAPALADAARNLGMIPSRDTAHLVQDPAGNWVVVGMPKPAQGAPPPPLNTKLPDLPPPAKPAPPAAPNPKPVAGAEVPTRVTGALPGAVSARQEVPVLLPSGATPGSALPGSAHAPEGAALPGLPPLPGPALAAPPAGDTLVAPTAPVAPVVPPVAAVPPTPGVDDGVSPAGPAQ